MFFFLLFLQRARLLNSRWTKQRTEEKKITLNPLTNTTIVPMYNGKQNTVCAFFHLALNTNSHICCCKWRRVTIHTQTNTNTVMYMHVDAADSLMNLLLKSMNDPVEIRNWTNEHRKKRTYNKSSSNNNNSTSQRIVCILWPKIHTFTSCKRTSAYKQVTAIAIPHINWWIESIKIIF